MKARKAQSHKEVASALQAVGASVVELVARKGECLGAPSLLVGFLGSTWLVRVASFDSKMTRQERLWRLGWKGSDILTVRSPAEALSVMGISTEYRPPSPSARLAGAPRSLPAVEDEDTE